MTVRNRACMALALLLHFDMCLFHCETSAWCVTSERASDATASSICASTSAPVSPPLATAAKPITSLRPRFARVDAAMAGSCMEDMLSGSSRTSAPLEEGSVFTRMLPPLPCPSYGMSRSDFMSRAGQVSEPTNTTPAEVRSYG